MSSSLKGKSAIVTGAARGIGKSIALELARQGVDVLVCARSERNDPEMPGTIGGTAEEVTALGARGVPMRVDLLNDTEVHAMVERALAEFGRADFLVNNAAYLPEGAFLSSSVDELDNSHRVNVHAAYLATQLLAPSMIEHGGGAIFNITSGAARHPVAGRPRPTSQMSFRMNASYGITKAALDRFTSAIAQELAEHQIALVAINPGFTNTERTRWMVNPGTDMAVSNSPEETAETIAQIALEPMKYTGQVIDADDFVAQK